MLGPITVITYEFQCFCICIEIIGSYCGIIIFYIIEYQYQCFLIDLICKYTKSTSSSNNIPVFPDQLHCKCTLSTSSRSYTHVSGLILHVKNVNIYIIAHCLLFSDWFLYFSTVALLTVQWVAIIACQNIIIVCSYY